MKVDEEIRGQLLKNFRKEKAGIQRLFDSFLRDLTEAQTVEQIMKAKKHLLIGVAEAVPLDAKHCYFCFLQSPDKNIDNFSKVNCKDCQYARYHNGICIENSNSVYSKTSRAVDHLIHLCYDFYCGETYKDPKPEKLAYLPGDVWKVTDPLLTHLRSAFILEYPYLGNEKIALAYLIHRDGYIEISTILIQHIKQRIYNQAATINRSDNEDAG